MMASVVGESGTQAAYGSADMRETDGPEWILRGVPASMIGWGCGIGWDESEVETWFFEREGLLDGACVSERE